MPPTPELVKRIISLRRTGRQSVQSIADVLGVDPTVVAARLKDPTLADPPVTPVLPTATTQGQTLQWDTTAQAYVAATPAAPPAETDPAVKGIVDVKGDLLVATADNTVARVPVGADGQVLTADAASAAGLKWAAAGGGAPSPTWTEVTPQSGYAKSNIDSTMWQFAAYWNYGGYLNLRGVMTKLAATANTEVLTVITGIAPLKRRRFALPVKSDTLGDVLHQMEVTVNAGNSEIRYLGPGSGAASTFIFDGIRIPLT